MILWNQTSISNLSSVFLDNQRRIQHKCWHYLDTTSKQRSRSFILVPINFSYTTFCGLSQCQ